jgi:hypothetical protein
LIICKPLNGKTIEEYSERLPACGIIDPTPLATR